MKYELRYIDWRPAILECRECIPGLLGLELHSAMQQAARVSHRTAYFHLGRLIEVNPTEQVFTMPEHELTEAYITGRFG